MKNLFTILILAALIVPSTVSAALINYGWTTNTANYNTYPYPQPLRQRVMVGTTTPYAQLTVSASSSPLSTVLFTVASSTGSRLFSVLGSGNVGIGTSSPYATLSVVGQAVATYFTSTSTVTASTFPYASTTAISSTQGAHFANSGGVVRIGSTAGTGTNLLSVLGGSDLATAYFYNNVTGKTQVTIREGSSNAPGDNSEAPFQVLDSGGTQVVSIRGDGVVNSKMFNATDNGSFALTQNNDAFSFPGLNYNTGGGIYWSNNATNWWQGSKDLGISRGAANKLYIGTGAPGSSAGTLIAGSIGIGTTSPYAALSVVGQTVAAYFTATTTTASTFPYASTTALSVSGRSYIGTGGNQVVIGTTAVDTNSALKISNASVVNQLVIGAGSADTTHTVDIYTPTGGSQNNVSLIRTANTQNNFLQFQPTGANSSSNVNWLLGTVANSNNFSFSTWNGSSVTEYLTVTNNTGGGFVGISSSTPSSLFSVGSSGTATSTVFVDSGTGKGSCLVMKDVDGTGFTYITANNGVLSASTVSCR